MTFPDLTFDEYRKLDAYSVSFFNGDTPAHWRCDADGPRKTTPAFEFGRRLHAYVFEDWRAFAVIPEGMDRRTKDGKAWAEENAGEVHVTQEDAAAFEGINRNILAATDDEGIEFLKQDIAYGQKELSCVVTDETTGLNMKARFDVLPSAKLYPPGRRPIDDLKSCLSASDFASERAGSDIVKFQYYKRAAWYLDVANKAGLGCGEYRLIVAEKNPPYAVRVLSMSDDALNLGRLEYKRDLRILKNCLKSNTWPAYRTNPEFWHLPKFMADRLEKAPTPNDLTP